MSERTLYIVTLRFIVAAIPFVLVFAFGLWLQLRRSWGAADKHDSNPRLAEELRPDDSRESRRERYRNLPLAERNAQDKRIAAAQVRRWRKKGLP